MDRVAISVLRDFEGLCASMDERFGRAKAFLVVDKKTGRAIETIDNASGDASHGAGTGAANLLSTAGVDVVVSGRFGPNALDALRALGIEAWIAPPGINAGLALLMFEGDRLDVSRFSWTFGASFQAYESNSTPVSLSRPRSPIALNLGRRLRVQSSRTRRPGSPWAADRSRSCRFVGSPASISSK